MTKLVILLTLLALLFVVATADARYLAMGDVNCDMRRDVVDAMFILQYADGIRPGSDVCALGTVYLPACDVNSDGACDAADAEMVLMCDVGLANELCPVDEWQ